ncbi:MAG: Guanylate kinase [Chloroflexi bacterium]|nr:Guanylate kinase [Chloroflexota bacterium]
MTKKNAFNPVDPEPLLIVISGPSGVGKDSVIDEMKERGLNIHFVVTATTRPPRPEEKNGVDYYFVTNDEFAEMIEKDELLEYAIVYNDYKGIPKSQVREALASGKDVVMRIDVQGAETVQGLEEDALSIFLTTETEEELVRRLKSRHTETDKSLNLRIATARKELEDIENFDYVVTNKENQLEKTVDIIEAIIHAEHHRVEQRQVTL